MSNYNRVRALLNELEQTLSELDVECAHEIRSLKLQIDGAERVAGGRRHDTAAQQRRRKWGDDK